MAYRKTSADSKRSEVNLDNIQGSIWPRLPHYYETFLFFKIQKTDVFKTHLKGYADNITTGAQCKKYFEDAVDDDIPQVKRGIPRKDIPPEKRERFEAVNISFSYKGIEKLVMQYRENKLDDELHIKGMYKDLVFEGPDEPESLAPEYRPPPGQSPNNDSWRVDGLFIVTGQTKDKLDDKVNEVKDAFKVHDTGSASVKIAFEKEGNLRNADGKAEKAKGGDVSLHGKEHFGFEDEISQPQIIGLDNSEDGGQSSILPGWIITGLKGDKAAQPDWATEGSFLVFREIEEKVPEFNEFVKTESKKMSFLDGHTGETLAESQKKSFFDDDTGERLAAYLMGRWKNGSPIELDPDGTKPDIFANNFDFDHRHSRKKNTKCPFAAHIRKMRPRADLYIERDDSDDSDDEEVKANKEVINSNVIIRRSITFGPEVDETEEKEKTKHKRGIYFLCYQSSIRNGFNFLVTRWASNKVFPPNKGIDKGPGVDPFISQRNRPDHPEGHVSIFNEPGDEQPYTLKLGNVPWIDQRGGEYFFTPSIEALKNTLSKE